MIPGSKGQVRRKLALQENFDLGTQKHEVSSHFSKKMSELRMFLRIAEHAEQFGIRGLKAFDPNIII